MASPQIQQLRRRYCLTVKCTVASSAHRRSQLPPSCVHHWRSAWHRVPMSARCHLSCKWTYWLTHQTNPFICNQKQINEIMTRRRARADVQGKKKHTCESVYRSCRISPHKSALLRKSFLWLHRELPATWWCAPSNVISVRVGPRRSFSRHL